MTSLIRVPYKLIRYILHNTWTTITMGGGKHRWSEWRSTLMPGGIVRHCQWCPEYETVDLSEFIDQHDHLGMLEHLVDEWGRLGTIMELARRCDDPEGLLRAAVRSWTKGDQQDHPMETLGEVETPGETPLRSNASACICIPCPYVGPIQEHGDCCVGSGIIDYSHDCPRPEDREMAERQHGPRPQRMGGPVGVGSRSEFCGCPPNGWSPDCLLRAHREFAQ